MYLLPIFVPLLSLLLHSSLACFRASISHPVLPFTQQHYIVNGFLTCGGFAAQGYNLRLYDKDPIFDDLMAECVTDSHGWFELEGSASEAWFGRIDPMLQVMDASRCYMGDYREWGLDTGVCETLPDPFINSRAHIQVHYDVLHMMHCPLRT